MIIVDNEFQIEGSDKTYVCERIVTGTSVLRQTIVVHGVGRKPDPANYGGSHGHPVSSMAGTATLIAREIIGERTRPTP
jgi:hypothetical protein